MNDCKVELTNYPNILEDVSYGAAVPHQFDIIYPKGDGPFKTIILIHAGGFLGGSRRDAELAFALKLVKYGYAIVTYDFHLSMEAKWPSQVNDLRYLINYLKENSGKYRIDFNRIYFLTAGSGTAIGLAYLALNSGNIKGFISLSGTFDFLANALKAPMDVELVRQISNPDPKNLNSYLNANYYFPEESVLGYSIHDNIHRATLQSPINRVTDKVCSALVIHGMNDQYYPYQDGLRFANKVNYISNAAWAKVELYFSAGYLDQQILSTKSLQAIVGFLQQVENEIK